MSERKELIKLLSIETPNLEKAAMLADYLLSHGVKIPVRCEECKYSKTKTDDERASLELPNGVLWCEVIGIPEVVYPDDYCSDGERKAT